MTRTAATIVSPSAIETSPDVTLKAFASMLVENSIGAALVRANDGGIAGVISERDVVRAMAEGADPEAERVSDYMTYDVEYASGDLEVAALAELMIEDAIRHLPVADADGKVIGVLSIRDVLAAMSGEG